MKKLSDHLATRLIELTHMQGKGTKLIGYTPGGYMPEELVYACGAIPVGLIRGGDPEPVAESAAYVPRFIDTFCRSQIGYRMLGEEPLYQMIDLLVVPVTDHNIKAIADCFNFFADANVFRFGVPHQKDEHAFEYYLAGLHKLKEKLEEFTGNKIENGRLREAIDLCNKMRALLREISLLRLSEQPPITGQEFVRLNHASFVADKTVLISVLESIHEELKKRPTASPKGPRILLTGSTLAMGDYKVLDIAEEAGASIVVEEFAEGIRHYWENVQVNGDLMESLADRYFRRRMPPAWFRPSRERLDYLIELAKDFNVDGIIWYQLMYRSSYDIQSFYFEKILKKELDIPMLKIESDYDVSERGPLRTRIETFVEIIKAGGGN
ncbi:MAG: 2-hydroxyacyl-CoA dehydratase family protein [Dehalococcoidia bacterium]|nr:2-hydroxyacyl-CoA dehydratase family protein [Dehalococcoidia bacterium]